MNTEEQLKKAIELMTEAFMLLNSANHDARTRELSVATTDLETAMMWLNKDRTMRGFLKSYPTHIEEKS